MKHHSPIRLGRKKVAFSSKRPAGWSAVPDLQRTVPGPSDEHRSDIRQTPAVWFVALTQPMQQTARPSPAVLSRAAGSRPALPGHRASKGSTQVRAPRSRGYPFGPLFVPRQRSLGRPLLPAPHPQLPGARVYCRWEAQTRAPRQQRRRPPPSPRRVPTPRPRLRAAPRPYLVDVAVGAAADALNQLEVFLRIPAGQIEAGVHGGPRVPPASLPGRGGGALRGPHGEWEPRPAPCSPGGHNRPAPRRRRRRRSSHAAAAAAAARANRPRPRSPPPRRTRVTPTRRGEHSQPLARGATPTWLPP